MYFFEESATDHKATRSSFVKLKGSYMAIGVDSLYLGTLLGWMEQLSAWIFALMLLLAPPEKRVTATTLQLGGETVEQMTARYKKFAADMAEVATNNPVFPKKPYYSAALMLAVSYMESGFRKDVDVGPCRRGECDHGNSFCSMQIQTGLKGKSVEGWTGAELLADRQKCFTSGANALRRSFGACGNLSGYTLGHCESDEPKAKARQALGERIYARLPIPTSPLAAASAFRF